MSNRSGESVKHEAVAYRPHRWRHWTGLTSEHAAMVDAILHPDGRCTCGGGGTCEWRRTHCNLCGKANDGLTCNCYDATPPESIGKP